MCIRTIIDADSLHHFVERKKKSAGYQLRRWVDSRHGLLIYMEGRSKYARELRGNTDAFELIWDFRQKGLAKVISDELVTKSMNEIPGRPIRKSNDLHVLALAKACDATLLFSCDGNLRSDFNNMDVLSKVGNRKRDCMPDLCNQNPKDVKGFKRRHKFLQRQRCFSK